MTSSTKVTRPTSSINPLKRGAACLNCRHFKIKCDGKRPHCSPCLTHPKEDGCEYQDGPRSRTKALEDKIAMLEAHIFELENPNQSPSMLLSQPYSESSPKSTLGVLVSPCSPSGLSSAGIQASPNSASSFLAQFEDIPKYVEEEPSTDAIQGLLDFLRPHAIEVGFFLDFPTFAGVVTQPTSAGPHSRPCPALLYSTYLWGYHFSQFHDVAQEKTFEARALRHCALDLTSSSHPDRVMHGIQANVLLAHFYLKGGRLPEAVYFASGAATLVTSAGLHATTSKLPAARSAAEAAERIDAYWTVFSLTRVLSILVRPSLPSLCPLMEVLGCDAEVPWPLDLSAKQQFLHTTSPQQQTSVAAAFIQGLEPVGSGKDSILALEVKAAMVLNEVTSLISRWDLVESNAESLVMSHQRLSHLVTNLRNAIPRLRQLSSLDISSSRLLAIGSMTEAAGVLLFQVFAAGDVAYRGACIKAAVAILNPIGIDMSTLVHVNPIMGYVWSIAINALEQECERSRYSSPASASLGQVALRQFIAKGLICLRHHAARNPMLRLFSEQFVHRDTSPHSSPASDTSHSFPTSPMEAPLQTFASVPSPLSATFSHQRDGSPDSSSGDYQAYQNPSATYLWPQQHQGLGLCM